MEPWELTGTSHETKLVQSGPRNLWHHGLGIHIPQLGIVARCPQERAEQQVQQGPCAAAAAAAAGGGGAVERSSRLHVVNTLVFLGNLIELGQHSKCNRVLEQQQRQEGQMTEIQDRRLHVNKIRFRMSVIQLIQPGQHCLFYCSALPSSVLLQKPAERLMVGRLMGILHYIKIGNCRFTSAVKAKAGECSPLPLTTITPISFYSPKRASSPSCFLMSIHLFIQGHSFREGLRLMI